MGEVGIAALLCGLLSGGATEMRQSFPNLGENRIIRIDCETPTHVIEIGLDNKAGSRDSVHQAVFSALLAGKTPMVVIIDTDGREDRYQYEIRRVADHLGIAYGTCSKDFVVAWAATSAFRDVPLDKSLNDLPVMASSRVSCDLGKAISLPTLE
ncbi:hypothetical protein [Anianabacter salinae]|uniref:hypothetical protein n=1 Tax=Anianabacter salinae TaxID=2851023 RepID=UPI00225DDD08|nr:hypothetical protein [Anianabacter salinae]MBV0914066.1 hypothetical protein [Anianabacter salinae]